MNKPGSIVQYDPTGNYIAVGSKDGNIEVFQLDDGRRIHQITDLTGAICSLQFSPNGKTLAACDSNGCCNVWSLCNPRDEEFNINDLALEGFTFERMSGSNIIVQSSGNRLLFYAKTIDSIEATSKNKSFFEDLQSQSQNFGEFVTIADIQWESDFGVHIITPYIDGINMERYLNNLGGNEATYPQMIMTVRFLCNFFRNWRDMMYRPFRFHTKKLMIGKNKLYMLPFLESDLDHSIFSTRHSTPCYRFETPESLKGEVKGIDHIFLYHVYILGILLYEMISGKRYLDFKTNLAEQARRVLEVKPVPLDQFCDISEDLNALVMGFLEKEPEKRWDFETNYSRLCNVILPFLR